jgi:hypothetical protein
MCSPRLCESKARALCTRRTTAKNSFFRQNTARTNSAAAAHRRNTQGREATMSDYFDPDMPECDLVIERGWRTGPNCSGPIIGVFANSEKGEIFLTAYCQDDDDFDDDVIIGSASFLPEQLDSFKRQARLAGVSFVAEGL